MSYYFSKKTDAPFGEVLTRVADELKKEGFGILTELDDGGGTIRGAADIEIQRYKILAGHRPPCDDEGEASAGDSGVELSCYVIAQGLPGGTVKVAAVDPAHTKQPADDPLSTISADRVREKLYHVIANI